MNLITWLLGKKSAESAQHMGVAFVSETEGTVRYTVRAFDADCVQTGSEWTIDVANFGTGTESVSEV